MPSDHITAPPRAAEGNPLLDRRAVVVSVVVLVVFFVQRLLRAFAYGDITGLVLSATLVGLALWTFLARDAWWVIMPVCLSFGGFFYFGFKILLHEVGLLLCLPPLILSLAVRSRPGVVRSPVPRFGYALLAYLLAHLAVSIYLAKMHSLSGTGHILRVYTHALWAVAFLILFHRFGKTTLIKQAFTLMYFTALTRIALGLIVFFFPAFLYIPGVNFILPATAVGFADLRTSAMLFAPLNLCCAAMSTSLLRRSFHILMVLAAGALTLMGSGRAAFLMFCAMPLLLALLRGRRGLMLTFLALLLAGALYLNLNPQILYNSPEPVRRTLSALVVHSPYHDVHREVRLSNRWHFGLGRLGRQNWLASPWSFLFGNRIYPFSEDYFASTSNMDARMEIAARIGAYESGLWTILAVLGLVGVLLYAGLFGKLLRGLAGEIRRHGIADHTHAFYFLALSSAITWFLFCWIWGHFPSEQLLFAAIAHAAYEDERRHGSPEASR